MKKKVLIVAPIFNSTSGYGQHAKVLVDALKEIEDQVDLYLAATQWANSNIDTNDYKNKQYYQYLNHKFNVHQQTIGTKFDISIQLMIPHEWNTDLAEHNIGVTALVETDKISPLWIECLNKMDQIWTISNFNKDTILSSMYNTEQGMLKFNDPKKISLVTFPVKDYEDITKEESLESFKFDTDFNFLACAQWGPRKNMEATVKWFLDTFKDNEKVGLVCKLHVMNNSTIDKYESKRTLETILEHFPDRKCKVYLIHGNVPERKLHSLYVHPQIKAIVSTTHGESWGLPLFESAYMGLPIIAPRFSGYLDFLLQEKDIEGKKKRKPYFADVDFVLKNVANEHIWEHVIIKGALWAHPNESSFKNRLCELYKDYNRFKTQALKLKEIIRDKYSEEKVYQQYIEPLKEIIDFKDYNFEDVTIK